MPDLSDAFRMIRELQAEVRRLRTPIQLENSSITDGRMRFIGGLLRVDSGGRVEIEGTLEGGGTFIWTGTLTNNGPLIQNGTWKLNGTGEIVGNTLLTGNLSVSGAGRIKVGTNLTLNPSVSGGAVEFGGGRQILANSNTMAIYSGSGASDPFLLFNSSGAVLSNGSDVTLSLTDGPQLVGLPDLVPGTPARYVVADNAGKLSLASVGGGGGDPGDPPAGNPNGYIWPSDPAVYGISDNFAAHLARGSAEPGVDVRTPPGTPIWSPANGTILAVNTAPSGATGRYITLITEDGDWIRMLHASAVSVSAGQTVTQTQLLGYTGGSGFGSEGYYGPHLHISFSIGYTGAFPGAANMNDFQAYMSAQ